MSPRAFPDAELRLLLIDADAARAQALADALMPRLPLRLVAEVVTNGRTAIETLRLRAVDLVLFDFASLSEPAAAAEEAVARLAKVSDGALLVALSDSQSISTSLAVMQAGAHDVIARPVAPDELFTRLARLSRRHGKMEALGLAQAGADSGVALANLAEATDQLQAIGNLVGWPGDSAQLQTLLHLLGSTADGVAIGGRRPILPMWQQEQRIIEDAIASFSGNIALAAAALELSPSTIYRKRQAWAEMEARKGAA